jgi:hypothetical protein
MSKISIYEVTPVPKLADKLIGTSVGGEPEDITYNFTLGELLNLFIPNIPQNTLQGVLDYGNTATQDIILNGTIFTTYLEVTNTATILDSFFTGETHILGGLYDSLDSIGTPGQVLTSTGSGVEWYSIPTVIPDLQQVLTSGNTADVDVILEANLEAIVVSADTAIVGNQLSVQGVLVDYNESSGSAGQVLASNSSNVQWVDLPVYTATSPLSIDSITRVISIQQASASQNGYLSSLDWINFDGKQPAGNYITALTGEATASGPGSASVTLSTSAVTGKLLTGLNLAGGGTITATDSILQAFGKVQNQISGMIGGVTFQGTWNASTNTPTLTSSVGTKGYYYIVDVAGSTNLNGITDWQVGDWAIFNGIVWDKVDNTDAVSSVNGFTGAVNLTTANIPEVTNLYYLDSRARAAISLTTTGTSGAATYNNTTGVFNIPQYQSVLTNPITGTGTSGQVAYFNGTSSLTSSATFAFTPTSQLLVNNSVTAASAIARGTNLTPTLTAAANSDVLVGLDINPTFTNGAFTGVRNYDLRLRNNLYARGSGTTDREFQILLEKPSGTIPYTFLDAYADGSVQYFGIGGLPGQSNYAPNYIYFLTASTLTGAGTRAMAILPSGNINIGSGITDAGFRLDVNGTARFGPSSNNVVINGYGSGNINVLGFEGQTNFGNSFSSGITGITAGNVVRATYASNGSYNLVPSVALSSGSITVIASAIQPVWNFTGTYSGIVRGLFYNPTLTSMTGVTHRAIETVSGDVLLCTTSGNVAIGTSTLATATELTLGGSQTASSAIARGGLINTTLVAAANNDVLVGLDVNPTFNVGAFTGLSRLSARFTGNVLMGQVPSSLIAYSYVPLTLSNNAVAALRTQLSLVNGGGSGGAGSAIDFFTYTGEGNGNPGLRIAGVDDGNYSGNFQVITKAQGGAGNGTLSTKFQLFGGTGNVLIQNGGTFTDAGFRLDVNGTARFSGLITGTDGATFGNSTSVTRGFGTATFTVGDGGTTNNSTIRISKNATGNAANIFFRNTSTDIGRIWLDNSDNISIVHTGNSTITIANTGTSIFGSITAASAIARGLNITSTLVAAANNDVLVGLDINPTFTNGAFTGVSNLGLRVAGVSRFTTVGINTSTSLVSNGLVVDGSGGINIGNGWGTSGASLQLTSSSTSANGSTIESSNWGGTAGPLNFKTSGTQRLQILANGNLLQQTNQNSQLEYKIANTTAGVNSSSVLTLQSDGSLNQGGIFKYSSSTTSYKILLSNDFGIYNQVAGDIAILNDFATGRIKLSAGGSSTAQATLFSTGNLAINTTTDAGFRLDVNGTARVSGTLTVGTDAFAPELRPNAGNFWTTGVNGSILTFGNSYSAIGVLKSTWAGVASGTSTILRLNTTAQFCILDYGNNTFFDLNNNTSGNSFLTIRGGFRGGTDQTPNNPFSIVAPLGTGTGTGGDIVTLIGVAGTTGTTRNTTAEIMRIKSSTANISIGANATPNASAILDITSTTKGVLFPRMTTTQKNAISSPAPGLMVYDTTLSGIALYNGTNWQNVLVPNSNNNVLIGTTTDNGQGTLQNTGSAFLGGLQVGGLTFSTSTTATTSTIFYYFNGGSGQTLTLPSTVGISSYFLIKNAGTADLTISRSGSTDTIMAPNGTSTSTTISLAVGSQAILVSNGAFVWIQIV